MKDKQALNIFEIIDFIKKYGNKSILSEYDIIYMDDIYNAIEYDQSFIISDSYTIKLYIIGIYKQVKTYNDSLSLCKGDK